MDFQDGELARLRIEYDFAPHMAAHVLRRDADSFAPEEFARHLHILCAQMVGFGPHGCAAAQDLGDQIGPAQPASSMMRTKAATATLPYLGVASCLIWVMGRMKWFMPP